VCAATVEERVPFFLKNSKTGWVSAEYGMLPCSCSERTDREAAKGKQSGRSLEIQRLIGRSLRSVLDLSVLGERQIKIDCDVIQADGGTRTASINGAFVSLCLACKRMMASGKIRGNPVKSALSAVSCGIVNEAVMVDLDYSEDSVASVDANFIMSPAAIVEIQSCGEKRAFSENEFMSMMSLARAACALIAQKQKETLQSVKSC
jgi:ribonuclease PH